MRIGSWNVNSLKARLSHVIDWLTAQKPDVLLLQELKGTEFPVDTFKAIGYDTEYVAQKTYNGVATLSRHPITVLSRNLLGDETDNHARYLEVDIQDLRIINIYLPNGNPIGTDRFVYKLAWMDRLERRLAALNKKKIPTVVGEILTSSQRTLIALVRTTGRRMRCFNRSLASDSVNSLSWDTLMPSDTSARNQATIPSGNIS